MPVKRIFVAIALLVAGVLAGVGAVAAEADGDPRRPIGAPAPATGVLSARRVPAVLAAPVADRRLVAALDAIEARQPGIGCLTVASAGRPVYSRDADTIVVPASVEKLLTAMAAFEVLGPTHRFTTRFVAGALPDADGVVQGDVWLVGGGDPLLATMAYGARFREQPQILTSVEALADTLVQAGVRRIAGGLVGDESRYDTDRYPDAWPERYVNQDQSGPLSALSVNDGWEAFPPNPDTRTPDEAPADDPPTHAAAVLMGLLEDRGIAIDGPPSGGPAPAGALELGSVQSPPMTDVITQLLRQSDNQTGELLLKELAVARGRPGTTIDGAAVVSEVANELGLPAPVVADGSGLAPGNRVTCSLLQAVLDHTGPDSALAGGLSVAGVNGTLTLRFLDSPVRGRLRAKTGTLNAVTSLAGFLDTLPGARISFALVVNTVSPDEVGDVLTAEIDDDELALQDELVAALDRYPEGPALELLSPAPAVTPEPATPTEPPAG